MTIGRVGKIFAIWGVLASALFVASASAESKARIVRLSDVRGMVQMDRGDGFEKTFLNMPVIEGARIKTGDDGRAEVEFEDGSALRVVPGSEVSFTRLALGDEGEKLSTVQLVSGTAYLNDLGKKGNQIAVTFGSQLITLTQPAHFRIRVGNDDATLAVFKGKVGISGQSGPLDVSEKHSATFDIHSDRYEVAKNYEEESYDGWDHEQSEYHDRYATTRSDVGSPYAYGMSDLGYYGNFMSVPGYGTMWQPYFIDAAWSPFMDGGWAFYPGYGYMWVSGYPWGWMPYRYGNWAFVPGYGWMWQPGYWNTWYALPRVVNPPAKAVIPQPPVRSRTTVMVGRGLATTPVMASSRLTVNPGSAGLGVPRGTVRDLSRLSRELSKNERPVEVRTVPAGQIAPPSRSAGAGSSSSARSAGSSSGASSHASPPMAAPRMSSPPMRPSKPH